MVMGQKTSRYFDYLPEIYRTLGDSNAVAGLNGLLCAVEAVLHGAGDPTAPGLAETIAGIPGPPPGLAGLYRFCEPGHNRPDAERAPAEFLEWLSGWVALSVISEIPEATQRSFIAQAVQLYRERGTATGLAKLLAIFTGTGLQAEVGMTEDDFPRTDRILKHGHERKRIEEIASSSQIVTTATTAQSFKSENKNKPHHFAVILYFTANNPAGNNAPSHTDIDLSKQSRLVAIAQRVIDAEKPAHCTYELKAIGGAFCVGTCATVGRDTVLLSIKRTP